jgi:chromosomal replication initiation ATPase DnaA
VLHLSRDELLSDRRTPDVVRARQIAIYLARERLSLSLGDLARAFGRDRATVLYSLRTVERDIGPDTPTSAALALAVERLDIGPAGGEAGGAG